MVNVDQWNNLSQFFIQTHSITLARFSKHCSVSVYTDIYEKFDKMKYYWLVKLPHLLNCVKYGKEKNISSCYASKLNPKSVFNRMKMPICIAKPIDAKDKFVGIRKNFLKRSVLIVVCVLKTGKLIFTRNNIMTFYLFLIFVCFASFHITKYIVVWSRLIL